MKQWLIDNESIVTTLLGALVGSLATWFLTHTSEKGRLRINVNTWELKGMVRMSDGYGGYKEYESIDNAQSFSYTLLIDINNTSNKTKIMRNIKLIFYNNKNSVYMDIPKDKNTERFSCHRHICDKIGAISIPAKDIITLNLVNSGISEKIEELKKATKIVLVYENDKGKTKSFTITNNPFHK